MHCYKYHDDTDIGCPRADPDLRWMLGTKRRLLKESDI